MTFAAKAVAHRVVILPDPIEEVSAGGIVVVTGDNIRLEKNAQVVGTILDIGPDAWTAFKPSQKHAGLKKGDKVFYAKYAGKWLPKPFDGLLVVNDEDIVAKVEDFNDSPNVAT